MDAHPGNTVYLLIGAGDDPLVFAHGNSAVAAAREYVLLCRLDGDVDTSDEILMEDTEWRWTDEDGEQVVHVYGEKLG